jgi:hypothetical protein
VITLFGIGYEMLSITTEGVHEYDGLLSAITSTPMNYT